MRYDPVIAGGEQPGSTLALRSTHGVGSGDAVIVQGGTGGATEWGRFNSTGLKVTGNLVSSGTGGVGYTTGAGGAVTQQTNRTTGVTINKTCGSITLVSAAGSTSIQAFTVTNSTVAATDTVQVSQKSGTDKYRIYVTAVAAGSFEISYATLSGTTTEQPVFNFSVIKAVAS